ncbi:hypothetical protein JOD01_000200 [Brevibacillus fulvus]|uniref:Uncharacterized protein n=1 Tax=Brevibacillus fulvus TaxID=1125967 RepID=A0A938XX67_9BACL|nr:hypothetical protein [Brevibacillus fulvus]
MKKSTIALLSKILIVILVLSLVLPAVVYFQT